MKRAFIPGMLALLLASPALAARRPDPREARAREACAIGDVQRGVKLLGEILAQRNDPNAIYNQARCYQANDQPEPALSRFREYLRVAPRLSARERRKVKDYMRELEQWLEARARRAALAAPAAAAPATAAATPTAIAAAPTPAVTAAVATRTAAAAEATTEGPVDLTAAPPPAPPPATGSRPLLIMSAVSAAAGVTALAGGAFYSLETRRIERQLERQSLPITSDLFQQRVREGQRAQSRQWIGYGAGAAALGVSGVLYLLGHGRF